MTHVLPSAIINENEPNAFVTVEGTVVFHEDNPKALHEQMYAYWDGIADQFPKSFWNTMGREGIAQMWEEPARAIYELTPTRVSGVIM